MTLMVLMGDAAARGFGSADIVEGALGEEQGRHHRHAEGREEEGCQDGAQVKLSIQSA